MWACIGGLIFYLSLVLFFINKSSYQYKRSLSGTELFVLLFMFVLYGVFGLCFGDFWSYGALVGEAYERYKLTGGGEGWATYLHMEPLYNYLAVLLHGNYYLWRAVWYIVEFSGLIYLFKRLNVATYESFYLLSICALYSICAGRVSWGITFYWLGIYTFYRTRDYKILLFVAASFFAHNSMILLFAMLPLSLLKINKTIVVLSLLILPSISAIFGDFLNDITEQLTMLSDLDSANAMSIKLETYKNAESFQMWGRSIGENVQYVVSRIPLYYMILVFVRNVLNKKIKLTKGGAKLFSVMFFLFDYTCIVLVAQIGSASFYDRYLMMLYLPIFILMFIECRPCFVNRRDIKICLFLLFFSVVISYVKSAYYYSVEDPTYRLFLY